MMSQNPPPLFDPHHPYKVIYSTAALLVMAYFITDRALRLYIAGWWLEAFVEGVLAISMLVSAYTASYECVTHHRAKKLKQAGPEDPAQSTSTFGT